MKFEKTKNKKRTLIHSNSFSVLLHYLSCFFCSILFFGHFSCSLRTCKPGESISARQINNSKLPSVLQEVVIKKVKVYKDSGRKQCEPESGTLIKDIERELSGLIIYSRSTESDGLLRTQMCGQSAGLFHVFEINESDSEKAFTKGFKIWKNP